MPHVAETLLMLEGPAGLLEARFQIPEQAQALAIVCHPHPLFGGTMDNKVVTTIARTMRGQNAATLRFNYRGVGKSTGQYGEAIGETEDLLAIYRWARSHYPGLPIWFAGFSFGGYIVIRAAMQVSVACLVTIAPAIHLFEKITPQLTMPWTIIQGDQDEVVAATEVIAWAETCQPQPHLIIMPKTSHFFHGQLTPLQAAVTEATRRHT